MINFWMRIKRWFSKWPMTSQQQSSHPMLKNGIVQNTSLRMFIEKQQNKALGPFMLVMSTVVLVLVEWKRPLFLRLYHQAVLDLQHTSVFTTCVHGWSSSMELNSKRRTGYRGWVRLKSFHPIASQSQTVEVMHKPWNHLRKTKEIILFWMAAKHLSVELVHQIYT